MDISANRKIILWSSAVLIVVVLALVLVNFNRVAKVFKKRDASFYLEQGNTYKRKMLIYDAIDAYDMALKLASDNSLKSSIYVERGIANAAANRWDRTLADLDKAVELDPNNANAYYNRGIAKMGMNLPDAISDLDKMIELKPKEASLYHAVALIYKKQKLREKAIAAYNMYIEYATPDNPADLEVVKGKVKKLSRDTAEVSK